jgi:hypothetical protein
MRAQISRRRRRKNKILKGEVQTDCVHLNFGYLARRVGSIFAYAEFDRWLRNIEYECGIGTRLLGLRGQRVTAE